MFAALQSGNDHIAFEAARLLLRLFAPAAARAGAVPWHAQQRQVAAAELAAATRSDAGGLDVGQGAEDTATARVAKSICLISDSR
jgi:DnaJ family protein C protein 13